MGDVLRKGKVREQSASVKSNDHTQSFREYRVVGVSGETGGINAECHVVKGSMYEGGGGVCMQFS